MATDWKAEVVRAAQIAEQFPCIGLDDQAQEAARLIVQRDVPGIVAIDLMHRPCGVLSVCDVLGWVVPRYVHESACLARVFDERDADTSARLLAGRRVGDMLPATRGEMPVVRGRATAIELAAVMKRWDSPLVVVQHDGRTWGVITATHLLARLIAFA